MATPMPDSLPLTEGALEELQWWTSREAAAILARDWPWSALATTTLYARHGAHAPMPRFVASGDASDSGIGLRWGTGTPDSEPLPPELPATSPSVCRELYVMCRLVERGTWPRGTVVRLVSDSTGACRTAIGATVCVAAAPYARRLFTACLARGITIVLDWRPRAELAVEDDASRWDAGDAAHATLAHDTMHALWRDAWGDGCLPDLELFAAPHNRVASAARWCARVPYPTSAGDGLTTPHLSTARRVWAYPPFALARPFLRRIAAQPTPPRVIAVLPDDSQTRRALHTWRRVPLSHILMPPLFTAARTPPRAIAAFISPTCGH